jgi:hypothetical protein
MGMCAASQPRASVTGSRCAASTSLLLRVGMRTTRPAGSAAHRKPGRTNRQRLRASSSTRLGVKGARPDYSRITRGYTGGVTIPAESVPALLGALEGQP